MIVRILIGAGLFALGYFVGKEMGRAEYIRDQLEWASEEDELMSTYRDLRGNVGPGTSQPMRAPDAVPVPEGS